jgi:IS605 OrfB family transposase
VYNKTIHYIKEQGHKVNSYDLRDLLVTEYTKKGYDVYKEYDEPILELKQQKKIASKEDIEMINSEIKKIQSRRRERMRNFEYVKNPLVRDFELAVPKDIRACAVNRCCDSYKSGFSNLRNGNIKVFNMHYKKKKEVYQSFELTPKLISIQKGKFKICPEFFGNDHCILNVSKNNQKKLMGKKILHNVDIVRSNQGYCVHLCIATEPNIPSVVERVAGVDLGIRTFATVHSSHLSNCETTITEYIHRQDMLKKLNNKLKGMKGRIRKKQYTKVERRKNNLVDCLHWDFINDLLSRNDIIYLGDIKSHDIVKGGKNKTLNQAFNDLKFYKLKQRLLYKAYIQGKKVIMVPEHYTTKTCSCCGQIHDSIGSNKTFSCSGCGMVTDRDVNASKNIKMKGFFL